MTLKEFKQKFAVCQECHQTVELENGSIVEHNWKYPQKADTICYGTGVFVGVASLDPD